MASTAGARDEPRKASPANPATASRDPSLLERLFEAGCDMKSVEDLESDDEKMDGRRMDGGEMGMVLWRWRL